MGLRYRTFRAAGSALLIAAAVGAGGMTGMTSVLAVDPSTVALTGSVADGAGAPLAGVHLVISEELEPDGGLAGFQATTGADGSFSVDVYAWGSAAAPAKLTIRTPADEQIEIVGDPCSQTWGVAVQQNADVTFADAAPTPLAITATTTLLGEVCGTTATPPPTTGRGGGAGLTPPPTDLGIATRASAPDRLGPALVIGFSLGLLIAVSILPRPGARRRR